MARLTCDICGKRERNLGLWLWWYHVTRPWREKVLHIQCAIDYADQRKLDGQA